MTTHLWFAGTPEFAAHSLRALLSADNVTVDAVLTQPDRPKGRGRKLTPSPVKEVALTHQLPLAQPEHLRTPVDLFPALPRPDLIIVAAYGLLLPEWFLTLPRLGCVNIHASLLPRWRGAAPIQRAIQAGDSHTGIAIMQMDKGLDTGSVWQMERIAIAPDDTGETLTAKLTELGAQTLLDALPKIIVQKESPIAQNNDLATYAHKLSKAEARIDWQMSAEEILRNIRAFNPVPVAHTLLNDESVRIYQASVCDEMSTQKAGSIIRHDKTGLYVATCTQVLRIDILQLSGKKAMPAGELANGRNLTGRCFQ